MKKRCAMLLLCLAGLVTAGCHFHGFGHPRVLPPGHAKKIVPVKVVGRPAAPHR